MDAPSGYRIEQAMSAWQSARARLLNDDPGSVMEEVDDAPNWGSCAFWWAYSAWCFGWFGAIAALVHWWLVRRFA